MLSRRAGEFVGILGWPLRRTLSPVIHSAAFRRLGLDWVYLSWPVPPEDLAAAVAGLRALGAVGANVTMPHKESAIPHLDDLSGDARAIGAVNTIQRVGAALIGHNTDIDGFSSFLTEDAGLSLTGANALVLGSGGAARAVVKAIDALDVASVSVAARRSEKAAEVAALAERASAEPIAWEEATAAVERCDLVVNATPVGMSGEHVLPQATFQAGQAVIDLIYEPPATPLVERARAQGAAAWGGLGMLVHQAAASLRIWTGQDPPVDAMSAAALHALGRR